MAGEPEEPVGGINPTGAYGRATEWSLVYRGESSSFE